MDAFSAKGSDINKKIIPPPLNLKDSLKQSISIDRDEEAQNKIQRASWELSRGSLSIDHDKKSFSSIASKIDNQHPDNPDYPEQELLRKTKMEEDEIMGSMKIGYFTILKIQVVFVIFLLVLGGSCFIESLPHTIIVIGLLCILYTINYTLIFVQRLKTEKKSKIRKTISLVKGAVALLSLVFYLLFYHFRSLYYLSETTRSRYSILS